jgi:ribosome-binding factor A
LKFKLERIKKDLIHVIMNSIILGEVKDPRIPKIITITKVTISKDLHYCHFYFSMLGNEVERKNALAGLNSASGFFQKIIGQKLTLRFTPKIEFRYDIEAENAYKIDAIIDKLSQERKDQKKQ